jgi:hypothetical protein
MGIAVNAFIVAVWIASRTVGVRRTVALDAEPIGLLDTVATLDEVVLLVGAVRLPGADALGGASPER